MAKSNNHLIQETLIPADPLSDQVYKDRLSAARKAAMARPHEKTIGPEWPRSDDVTIEFALTELALFIYEQGGKISCGLGSDASGVYVSLKSPTGGMDPKIPTQAFTASDTLDKALRKAAQLLSSDSSKIWKFDSWAAGRDGNPNGVR